jgi:hypothetical protein
VLEIIRTWADKTWTVGIEFGTIGLRKRDTIFEITTYRSEAYSGESRKPDVKYGTSLVADLERRDFTINAMAARLPSFELVDPFGGLAALAERVIRGGLRTRSPTIRCGSCGRPGSPPGSGSPSRPRCSWRCGSRRRGCRSCRSSGSPMS